MYIDFHTHGKLAKYLPFSTEYTDWLLNEAKEAGLDAICLTEHFNTQEFDTLYEYIASRGVQDGDAYSINGLKIFPGMETDIAEGGHVLSIGPMDAILDLNKRLEPYKKEGNFLPARKLWQLYSQYPLMVGAAHPYREGGHIPELPEELLYQLDFIDLNGKDIATDRFRTETLTYQFGDKLGKPVLAGSDTHQAVQYGSIRTWFENDFNTFAAMRHEIKAHNYNICIHKEAAFKVKTATVLKRSLKEIHALGGDYVSVLLGKKGESEAVMKAKERALA